MAGKLTLAEIAKHYRKTPKTFSRIVRADPDFPVEWVGRSPMFELVSVEAHFSARKAQEAKVVKFRPTVRKSRKTRFAEAVG